MDGAAALLNVSNPIGKELASLADMVGLVPGSVVFHLLEEAIESIFIYTLVIPIFSAEYS